MAGRTAFFAALIFALHPIAVYGTAYLTQRSIVMATLLCLLSLHAFLEGYRLRRPAWMLASVFLYGLAVNGEDGIHEVLQILRSGIRETMFGIGRSSLAELGREDLMVLNPHFFVPPAS